MSGFVVYRRPDDDRPPNDDGMDPLLAMMVLGVLALIGGWVWLGFRLGVLP